MRFGRKSVIRRSSRSSEKRSATCFWRSPRSSSSCSWFPSMETTWGNLCLRWTIGARRSGRSGILAASYRMKMFILHSSSKLQIDSFIHAHSRRNDEEDELMIEPDLMRANRWKKIPHFKLYSRCHLAREAYQTEKINCV
jgi:hypothetical protein